MKKCIFTAISSIFVTLACIFTCFGCAEIETLNTNELTEAYKALEIENLPSTSYHEDLKHDPQEKDSSQDNSENTMNIPQNDTFPINDPTEIQENPEDSTISKENLINSEENDTLEIENLEETDTLVDFPPLSEDSTEENTDDCHTTPSLVGTWAGRGDSDNLVLIFHDDSQWTLWKHSYGKWKKDSQGTYVLECNPLTLTLIDPLNELERTDDIELLENELHIIDPTFNEPYMTYEKVNPDDYNF